PVARSVATAPGRDVTDNARLLAMAAMAMDDALIAVFDAKYAYNFWRPVTAIRNAVGDARDAGWTPFIDTPMHPEYPCAHCIVSASLGAVLEAELGQGPVPKLSSASSTAGGVVRTWGSVGDFVQEVAVARIYDGVHYRNSAEVGTALGEHLRRRLLHHRALEEVGIDLAPEAHGVGKHELAKVVVAQQSVLDQLVGLGDDLGHVGDVHVADVGAEERVEPRVHRVGLAIEGPRVDGIVGLAAEVEALDVEVVEVFLAGDPASRVIVEVLHTAGAVA